MNTAASDHAFLGHPRGLAYLAFTEAWERFSYYGMQTLLVLYMVRQLLLPGHIEHIAGFTAFRGVLEHLYGGSLSTIALSSAIFGLYTGLVYLTPIGGGIIADRWRPGSTEGDARVPHPPSRFHLGPGGRRCDSS